MAETNQQTNPYLALLQQEEQAPTTAQLLRMFANLVGGASAGIGQTGTWGGVAPGLMMGIQANASDADQAEKRRLRRAEIGIQASKWDDERAERQQTAAAMGGLRGLLTAPGVTAPQQTPYQLGPGTPDQNAIGGIESGGRYDAVGPVANDKGQRAYGKYQIMDFNVGPWTQEVLGRPMTPQEFLANPQAQDAVFNAKFGQYSQKYGPVGASRAWFAGEGGMNNPNARDVNGMTVQRYGDRFAQSRGVASAPVGPPPVGLGGAGPTLSALPAFEGPGTGAIQPGALPAGVEPKVNLPAPFVQPQPPPQVAQGDSVTPGGSQVDPTAPAPPWTGQAQPQPAQQGDPNIVRTGGPQPPPQAPGRPPPDMPPKVPAPSVQQLSPEAKQRLAILSSLPKITPVQFAAEMNKEIQAEWQQRQEQVVKGWDRQWSEYGHYRGLSEQQMKTEDDRRHAAVLAQIKRDQELADRAPGEARAEAAAALAKENAARAAANQDVSIDPATGQPVINQTAVDVKKAISAAQGTDPSSKITLELAQDAIKRNSDWQKAGAAAGGTIRNIDIFNKLSDQVKTGKYQGSITDLKAALKGAGVNLEAWGISDKVAPAQAMQMMSQRFALEMRQEMPGPMSDGDRMFMERGALSLEKDPGANKVMAAWLKGNAEKAQDRAKFAREYIRTQAFKDDPAGIDDYVEQKLAGKDYFDHSVLSDAPAAPAAGKSAWELEQERRGKMNSATPR